MSHPRSGDAISTHPGDVAKLTDVGAKPQEKEK
jgi:hypothetical protein